MHACKVLKKDASKQDKKDSDSNTFGVKRLVGRRERVTVRIKPGLKEALKRFCSANGLSICHIFEALTTAYLVGVNQKINLDAKSPTINLTVERVIQRHRRIRHVYEPEGNFYDRGLTNWRYVPDADLNDNGHVIGCGCKVCLVDARRVVRNG